MFSQEPEIISRWQTRGLAPGLSSGPDRPWPCMLFGARHACAPRASSPVTPGLPMRRGEAGNEDAGSEARSRAIVKPHIADRQSPPAASRPMDREAIMP
jgi:hypothetical protein